MKTLLIALCMLLAFTAYSQSDVTYIDVFKDGKFERMTLTIRPTPKPSSKTSSYKYSSNDVPIKWNYSAPQEKSISSFTVPAYRESRESQSAQDAMKMLDVIIAGPKKN